MIIQQLSVFIEDKTGRLTEMTEVLASSNINLSAFSVADAADYGIVRMIVNKPEEAKNILKKAGFSVNITEVVCVVVPNQPGGLHDALKVLSVNQIHVDYLYAFSVENKTSIVIRTASNSKVIEVLQKNNFELLRADELYNV